MRILLFTSSYAPRVGGLETVTGTLARNLASRGHQVTVATNRYPRTLRSFETIEGIPVHRQLYPDLLPGASQSLRDSILRLALLGLVPVALLRLALLVRRTRPDVMNVHYFSSPAIYAILVAWICRVPVVLSFHGSDLSQRFPGRLLTHAIRASALCTTCSRDLASVLRPIERKIGRASLVVPNGVATGRGIDAHPRVPKTFVLVAARLVHAKGVDVAIEAIAALASSGVQIPLVIAGDGPERDFLETLVRRHGIEPLVSFLGTLEPASVRALMRKSWCVLVPSRAEGFGLVCLEAMSEEKPVIASRVGGIPEVVIDEETGALVPPDSPRELANALLLLMESGERARALGRAGRERALESFSWDNSVEGYLAAYTQAASRSGQQAWQTPA